MNNDTMTDLFGPPVYIYSRKQAEEDGFQVDVSERAREAGIRFPVFLTRRVWDECVEVPEGVTAQDESGRLWDVVWMLRCGIAANRDRQRFHYSLLVKNKRRTRVTLKAECGPMDHDDPAPAITVMFPDED